MNTVSITPPAQIDSLKADRVGIIASVLCAIHCAAAPILLLFLPAFGSIWAHPASHILVAVFVVPLAIFSIRKGFQMHRKRWIVGSAAAGILFVLVGAALPAFSGENGEGITSGEGMTAAMPSPESVPASEGACEDGCCDEGCCDDSEGKSEETTEKTAMVAGGSGDQAAACVDGCCPTATVDADGKFSLHIPPASIVTTLGGIFLIVAHVANLCACGHACRQGRCQECVA